MPRNKKQGIIFGGIMSYAMAYGMEVYNVAIKEGVNLSAGGLSNMTNIIFWEALKEAAYMGILVFIFSSLWGNRLGAAFAERHCDPAGITRTYAGFCGRQRPSATGCSENCFRSRSVPEQGAAAAERSGKKSGSQWAKHSFAHAIKVLSAGLPWSDL